MTASILKGTCPTVVGSLTSGGTESIILATRAHKEYAAKKKGITHPEIIACVTAHAAIEKACEMLGIHLIHVPFVPGTFKVDVAAVRRCITSDTIMIYSSAPNFPSGIIDPIRELSELAVKYGVGLHVDMCLGGFVLPFAKKLNYPVGEFDFSLPGVTSISIDTHKYGYACKGSSVVLYRTKELRRFQYFTAPKWTGGLYCTSTVAGSRPGAVIAATWASMVHMGEEGYKKATREIMETTQAIIEGVKQIPELTILGQPVAMIIAFSSSTLNIYAVNDNMTHRGWALNALQNPASVHFCVTLRSVGRVQDFLNDLKASVQDARNQPASDSHGSAPIYGAVGSLPAGPVKDVLCRYLDVTYS
jgi:glutamate/tyrosine decarboxylase-like PLP-dependent enzyme